MKRRLGIVASSGGAVFDALSKIIAGSDIEFTVITDRPCEIENTARQIGARLRRIVEPDRAKFSCAARDALSADTDRCLLFFVRLVGPELFNSIGTYNIHPSLLPAYQGFKAVERARGSGARILGATLHQVNEAMDDGPILAQIASGADPSWPIERWKKLSFLQKVYLSIMWVEISTKNSNVVGDTTHAVLNSSPCISNAAWLERFVELECRQGMRVTA